MEIYRLFKGLTCVNFVHVLTPKMTMNHGFYCKLRNSRKVCKLTKFTEFTEVNVNKSTIIAYSKGIHDCCSLVNCVLPCASLQTLSVLVNTPSVSMLDMLMS